MMKLVVASLINHVELIAVLITCGNSMKEMLEGLHVVQVIRVHRSYFELKVSLLKGKKQTYLNITCCAIIGRIIIRYL